MEPTTLFPSGFRNVPCSPEKNPNVPWNSVLSMQYCTLSEQYMMQNTQLLPSKKVIASLTN